MINLSAKIELLGGNDFETIRSNIKGNKDLQSLLKTKVENSKDGWIGSENSNANGDFETPYLFFIHRSTTANATFNIDFDKTNGGHPKNIEIGSCLNRKSSNKKTVENPKTELYYDNGAYMYKTVLHFDMMKYTHTVSLEEIEPNSFQIFVGDITNYEQIDLRYFVLNTSENDAGFYETVDIELYTSDYQGQPTKIIFSGFNSYYYQGNFINGSVLYGNYVDDDTIFNIVNKRANALFCIRISNWNKPNSPLIITGIYTQPSIDVDLKNMTGLSRNIIDRSDTLLPSYGIISNTGSIQLIDKTTELGDLANQNGLNPNMRVDIYLNNTLEKKSQLIGMYETGEWQYDNNSREVNISINDDLEEWQDIYVEGINYDPRNPYAVLKNGSMEDLYKWLQDEQRTPSKYQMLTFDELDQDTKTILTNTILKYPLLNEATLWEQWTKLCQVCGLYIYKNGKGKTTCSYTYGS